MLSATDNSQRLTVTQKINTITGLNILLSGTMSVNAI